MGIIFDNMKKPKIVYKYYPWDQRFDSKRLNGYVYYSSPLNFNDKLDCNLPVDNIPSDVDMNHLAKIVKESCYSDDEYASFINQVINNNPKALERLYYRQRENLGILCLSDTPDNPVLWAHYAHNNGFIVAYDREELIRCSKNTLKNKRNNLDPDKRVEDGWVNYVDCTTDSRKLIFTSRNDYIDKYWVKHKSWESESEYRIGISLGGNMEVDAGGAVREIILGCNPMLSDYIHCLQLLKDNEVKIRIVSIHGGKYNIEEISCYHSLFEEYIERYNKQCQQFDLKI